MARPKRPSLRVLKQEVGELVKRAERAARQLVACQQEIDAIIDGTGEAPPTKRKAGPKPPKVKRKSVPQFVGDLTLSQWIHAKASENGKPCVTQMFAEEATKHGVKTRSAGGVPRLVRQIVTRSSKLEWCDEEKRRFKRRES